jgi:hypothetical protein
MVPEARVAIGFSQAFLIAAGNLVSGKPTDGISGVTCQVARRWVEPEKLHDDASVFRRGPILVLFPLLYRRVADFKSQQFSELRHGQVHVDTLLAQVFAQGFGVDRIPSHLPKVL